MKKLKHIQGSPVVNPVLILSQLCPVSMHSKVERNLKEEVIFGMGQPVYQVRKHLIWGSGDHGISKTLVWNPREILSLWPETSKASHMIGGGQGSQQLKPPSPHFGLHCVYSQKGVDFFSTWVRIQGGTAPHLVRSEPAQKGPLLVLHVHRWIRTFVATSGWF